MYTRIFPRATSCLSKNVSLRPVSLFSSSPLSCTFSSSSSSNPDSSPRSAYHDEYVNPEHKYGYNSPDNNFETFQRSDEDRAYDPTNRTMNYLVQGTAGFIYASFARAAISRFVNYCAASADVLALSTVEIDMKDIKEGSASTFKWQGKPIFIRYRTQKEIDSARELDSSPLRDPATDASRFPAQNGKYAVLIGICTHLGCVPVNGAGDYGGWFCPCHGSHYDTSGRIHKGPAPLNLEIPPYKFLSDTKILLG